MAAAMNVLDINMTTDVISLLESSVFVIAPRQEPKSKPVTDERSMWFIFPPYFIKVM